MMRWTPSEWNVSLPDWPLITSHHLGEGTLARFHCWGHHTAGCQVCHHLGTGCQVSVMKGCRQKCCWDTRNIIDKDKAENSSSNIRSSSIWNLDPLFCYIGETPQVFQFVYIADRFGKTLIIQDVDEVEPILFPLLRGDLISQGEHVYLSLASSLIRFSSNESDKR